MNRKGFTLVELIAMLVVIGVLMAITVPNISGIVKNNRENIQIEDINKMVASAKQRVQTKKAKNPKEEKECVVMTLDFLDTNNDFKTGTNNGTYDRNESLIVVTKKKISGSSTSEYKYYVRLVETKNANQAYVINLTDYSDFSSDPKKHTAKLTNFGADQKFNVAPGYETAVMGKINAEKSGLCNSISAIYA